MVMAAASAGMVASVASAAGGQPCSRSVAEVIGPMEMAATPGIGNGKAAEAASAARCVTLEELVTVAASIPCYSA